MKIDNRRQTVLLVEDDPSVRKLIKTYLERMGLSVLEEGNGSSALRRLREMVPDLVCLDLVLPELSGYEVCEFIRRTPALRDVPVLVVSGRTSPIDRAHATEVGASAYLIKPFGRREFSKHVSALLGILEASAPSEVKSPSQPSAREAGSLERVEDY